VNADFEYTKSPQYLPQIADLNPESPQKLFIGFDSASHLPKVQLIPAPLLSTGGIVGTMDPVRDENYSTCDVFIYPVTIPSSSIQATTNITSI
jgi:hypothetical protein